MSQKTVRRPVTNVSESARLIARGSIPRPQMEEEIHEEQEYMSSEDESEESPSKSRIVPSFNNEDDDEDRRIQELVNGNMTYFQDGPLRRRYFSLRTQYDRTTDPSLDWIQEIDSRIDVYFKQTLAIWHHNRLVLSQKIQFWEAVQRGEPVVEFETQQGLRAKMDRLMQEMQYWQSVLRSDSPATVETRTNAPAKIREYREKMQREQDLLQRVHEADWETQQAAPMQLAHLKEKWEEMSQRIEMIESRSIYSSYWFWVHREKQINVFWFLNTEKQEGIVPYTRDVPQEDQPIRETRIQTVASVFEVDRFLSIELIERLLESGFYAPSMSVYHAAVSLMDLYYSQARRVVQKQWWPRLAAVIAYWLTVQQESDRTMLQFLDFLLRNKAASDIRSIVYNTPTGNLEIAEIEDAKILFVNHTRQFVDTVTQAFVHIPITVEKPDGETSILDHQTIFMSLSASDPMIFLARLHRYVKIGPAFQDLSYQFAPWPAAIQARVRILPNWSAETRTRICYLSEYYLWIGRWFDELLTCPYSELADACLYIALLVLEDPYTRNAWTGDNLVDNQTLWNACFGPYTTTYFPRVPAPQRRVEGAPIALSAPEIADSESTSFLRTVFQVGNALRNPRNQSILEKTSLYAQYAREEKMEVALLRIPRQVLSAAQILLLKE